MVHIGGHALPICFRRLESSRLFKCTSGVLTYCGLLTLFELGSISGQVTACFECCSHVLVGSCHFLVAHCRLLHFELLLVLKLFLHCGHLGQGELLLLLPLQLEYGLDLLRIKLCIGHDFLQLSRPSEVQAQHLVLLPLALQDKPTDIDVGARLVEL